MKLALDTNRYTDFAAGNADVTTVLEQADEIRVPFVVLGELRAGFRFGSKPVLNERRLIAFLSKPSVSCVLADEETTLVYASIWHRLRSKGKLIPTNDIWIASLCVQQGLTLYTRDAHFADVDGLALL